MEHLTVWESVLIGVAGGSGAGLSIWIVRSAYDKAIECRDKCRIYKWLSQNTVDEDGKRFRSTRAIASWTNLTEDRVRYVCSIHKRIYLSTGSEEGMWGLYELRKRQ